ncbi:MAG: LD-carboxypeptidase [Deltaproteobacteria bacterium]|nr:LD-carboxypeptidase [Deltaproteobacteria bacterium]
MKPTALKLGDKIGVLAPSSPCSPERFQTGIKEIERRGYRVEVALDPVAAYGKSTYLFSSDTAARRTEALHALFQDSEIKAVIAARGAYGSLELLPHIDFELIKKNPKIFVGFSDVTILLSPMFSLSNLNTFHGPMVSGAFAEDLGQHQGAKRSVDLLLEVLRGNVANPFSDESYPMIQSGEGQGVVKGGSLTSLVSLLGTKWEPELDGSILFLEEIGERPYQVHRLFMQLKLAGKLEQLSGVILGSFTGCSHAHGPTVADVFKDIFGAYGYPVISGVPAGHGPLNLVMPLGIKAKIYNNRIEFLESGVNTSNTQ